MIRKSVLCATLLVVGLCSLSDSVIAQDLEDEFRGVEATQQRDLMTEDATTLAAAEDVSSPVRSSFGLNGRDRPRCAAALLFDLSHHWSLFQQENHGILAESL